MAQEATKKVHLRHQETWSVPDCRTMKYPSGGTGHIKSHCRATKRPGAGKQIYKQSPLQTSVRAILRCIAESYRCPRFCRPVPNHSANAP